MKIFNPNYTAITDYTPKVIETGRGFLLNTQYHLKNNLSPVPFEFVRTYGSTYHLNLNKSLYCESYSWNRKNIEDTIIQDDFIPNRYYIFTHSGYQNASRATYLCITDEKDTTCNLVKDPLSFGDVQFHCFVAQTDELLFFIAISNKTWYLYKYHKINHTNTECFRIGYTYSQPNPVVIYKDSSYFYFLSYSDNNIAITRYDVLNNTQTTATTYRGQMTATANYNLTQQLQPVQVSTNEYGAYVYNCGNQAQPIGLYCVDVTIAGFNTTWATACRYIPVNITWNADKTSIDYNTSTHSTSTYYRSIIREINNKKYFQMFVHNHNFENVVYIPYQGIYTFEIVDEDEFTFLNYDNIDTTRQINGYIFDDTFNTMIVAFKRAFKVYKFSSTDKKYIDTGVELPYVYDVGLDETNRLWYLRTDGSVHLANLNDAEEVDIRFAQNYYEYTGTDINTYITFSANTYLGEDASGTFNLSIEGPAYFTSNGKRDISIEYSGEVDIPVTITGAAPITIYPRYLS